MTLRRRSPTAARRRARASFTLLEVVIAMGIFFAGIFAILNLVSQNLQFARELNEGEPDVGTVAAELFMEAATNQDLRAGGGTSGDFGDLYPGAAWSAELNLVLTNSTSRGRNGEPGLYQADIVITWPSHNLIKERKVSLLLYLQ